MAPDSFSNVSTSGLGGRLMNSIMGVLIGAVMFLASFPLLYWNEGRPDLSKAARGAAEVPADGTVPSGLAGKLVYVHGASASKDVVGDELIKQGQYIALQRKAETYAWVETKHSSQQKNMGGSVTTTTEYSYEQKWTENPESSSKFHHPEGHENPRGGMPSRVIVNPSVLIGARPVETQGLDLPTGDDLQLDPAIVKGDPAFASLVPHGTQFTTADPGAAPKIGDQRITYHAIKTGTPLTVFGQLDTSGSLVSERVDGWKLFRAFTGSHDDAIEELKEENTMVTWGLRIGGFLLMWIGLSLFFGPIETLLDVLPFLGSVARGLGGFAAFLVALPLWGVTIIVSIIAHSPIALGVAGVVALLALVRVFGHKQGGAQAAVTDVSKAA